MVETVLHWIAGGFLLIGSVFCLIGGLGLLRLPDFYSRTHAAGVTDTFGAGFVLVGLMLWAGPDQAVLKLMMVLFFMLVTGPASTHALAKAAYAGGVRVEREPAPTIDPEDQVGLSD